jgi:glycosyltransferase involved in cell wall biosynthesis
MRVMLFSDTYTPQVNGVATSVHTLAQALSEGGHEVMVYTINARGTCGKAPDDSFPVMRVSGMPLPFYTDYRLAPPAVPHFDRVIRHFAPDVLHFHTPFGIGWRAISASRACGLPLIGTHHTLFGAYVDVYAHLGARLNGRLAALARQYIAAFYNQCDVVSCASRFLASDLIRGGLKRPVRIVPNPLNTALFHPLAPPPVFTEPAEKRLIYFGRLAAEKNLHQLILLVEPVLHHHRGAILEVVGDGPVKGSLMELVQQRHLEQQVRFVGFLRGEALAHRVATSRLFVTASLTENQPMTVLESLACGVPAVALAAAGVPEIIADRETGFLVPPDDASGLFSQRVEQLLRDEALHEYMSQQAIRSAQRYTQAAVLQATLESYQQAIESAAARQRLPNPQGQQAAATSAGLLTRRHKRIRLGARSFRAWRPGASRQVVGVGRLLYNKVRTRHETTTRGG